MLTKRNVQAERQRAVAAGTIASIYITKPFDAYDLQTMAPALLNDSAP